MLSTLGLKPSCDPRQLGTSWFSSRLSAGSLYHSRAFGRASGLSGAKSCVGSRVHTSPSSAQFSLSASGNDEGLQTLVPGSLGSSADLMKFLRPKIRSYDYEVVRDVFDHYDSSGLKALERVSATEWLLQWGIGHIDLPSGQEIKKMWPAWRIYVAYNAKTRGDVSPFPADFLKRLPKDIFDNEKKFKQSIFKQQALFTIHMNSVMSDNTYSDLKGMDEEKVMSRLRKALSHDPWAMMMKHSTFSFREMEAVAERFNADMSCPSRGAAALVSRLNEMCRASKVSYVGWPELEMDAAKSLGPHFKTPLRQCMTKLKGKVMIEFSDGRMRSGWRAMEPVDADASKSSWASARCFLRPIYNAEIKIKDFAEQNVKALTERNSITLAAQISDARARRQRQEKPKGSGAFKSGLLSSSPPSLRDMFLYAIHFKRSDAAVPYPDPDKVGGLEERRQAMERRAAAEKLSRFQLDEKQHQALMTAATNQVLVLTGAAGCGKTYATHAILTYFKSLGSAIHLMAPTGRAASNMRTMTNEYASTIHSALNAMPLDNDESIFAFRGPEEPLDGIVIIDEASMVDLRLMSHIIGALGPRTRVIFVGDVNQLPPVSLGAPFQDLVAWNKLPSVYLNQVHRQQANSSILDAAHLVLRGKTLGPGCGLKFVSLPDIVADVLEPASIDGSEFSKVLADSDSNNRQRRVASGLAGMLGSDAAVVQLPTGCKEDEALACLVNLVANLKACGADPQVISPATGSKFPLRVDAVNKSLHPVMNDNMYEISQGWRLGFYKGDRVVQERNDPDNGLANGDQGVVKHVTFSEGEKKRLWYKVFVDFPQASSKRTGEPVEYDVSSKSDLEASLKLAWGVSVHKAQGGGFPIVVLFLHESMGGNLRMPMLYTAITRASGLLLILSTVSALTTRMILSDGQAEETSLMQRLKGIQGRSR